LGFLGISYDAVASFIRIQDRWVWIENVFLMYSIARRLPNIRWAWIEGLCTTYPDARWRDAGRHLKASRKAGSNGYG
jgi:hypothetical protein